MYEPDRTLDLGSVTLAVDDRGGGEHDTGLRDQADLIAKVVPGGELVVIDGAAHCPQEERRELWLAAVRGHLA